MKNVILFSILPLLLLFSFNLALYFQKILLNHTRQSEKEFVQKLKLNQKTIRRYEVGVTKPDRITIEKMTKVLKVSVRSLVNGKGGKKK